MAPAASEFPPETFIGTTESLGVSPVHVVEPSAEPSIVIDTVALRTLSNKFAEVASASGAEGPCLPKISVTKLFNDTVSEVNVCIQCLLADLTPSLLQCVHLLYAAAATIADLLHQPQPSDRHPGGSWKLRLEMIIRNLRRDLSRLVAGEFPPCGSRRLLYLL